MGSHINDWAEATGAMYIGSNSSWEVIWFLVAVGICVIALVMGSKHELDAYKRLKKGGDPYV